MKKKIFRVETKKLSYDFPFSRLEVQPIFLDPIVKLYIDRELAYEGFTYVLQSGKEGSVVWDQVLDYNKDPAYENDILLAKLTAQARSLLKHKKISKRELARRLRTSPSQIYRLLDTTFYGKTIDQMIKLLAALDYRVEFVLKKAA